MEDFSEEVKLDLSPTGGAGVCYCTRQGGPEREGGVFLLLAHDFSHQCLTFFSNLNILCSAHFTDG